MARLLALSLWFASVFALPGCNAQESAQAGKYLTESEAGNAEFVSRWLAKHRAADQKDAQQFMQQALREKQRSNWSAATKAFGESMIRYPSPQALAGYAEAELRMLGAVRARDKNVNEHMAADMKHALAFYESALSANAVLRTLPAQESEQLQKSVDCLKAYLASASKQAGCVPLEIYLAGR